jgi:XTP/dITP diphosphohydrolase
MPKIVLASTNRHKIAELEQMLAGSPEPAVRAHAVVSASALGYGPVPDIPETSEEFVGNALLKVHGIAEWLREHGEASDTIVIADDSGLCVDALAGAPGVYSARFAGPEADDDANNAKLVAELEARGLARDGSAGHYVCVLAARRVGDAALAWPGPQPEPSRGAVSEREGCLCLEGRCHGRVRTEGRGHGGFGYDPYFWIDGETRTFAELSPSAKAERSHRGAAMRLLVEALAGA